MLGAVAGMIGSLPQLLLNFVSKQLGIAKSYDFQISGGVYLLKKYTLTPGGILLGLLTWESIAVALGIVTAYVIRATGKEYWWFKGLFVADGLMYTFLYGYVFALGGPKVIPWDVPTNLSMFVENIIFGVTTGYVVARYMKQET